jgi:hypothetical protein
VIHLPQPLAIAAGPICMRVGVERATGAGNGAGTNRDGALAWAHIGARNEAARAPMLSRRMRAGGHGSMPSRGCEQAQQAWASER